MQRHARCVLAGGDPVDAVAAGPSCPTPASSSRPTRDCTRPPALGLHVDRIVGDLDSADPDAVEAAVAAGAVDRTSSRRPRTRPISSSRSTPPCTTGAADRRRRRRRRPPRPLPRQHAAARVARVVPTCEIEARFGDARVRRARRRQPACEIEGSPGSLVTLLPVGGAARGIVTDGLEYPLVHEDLAAGHDARRQQRHDRRRARRSRSTTERCSSFNPIRKRGAVVIVDIEVVPQPLGTDANRYAHVEAAIALAQASGLHYEVNALGTTIEGRARRRCGRCCGRMHESCLAVGRGARHHGVQDRRARRGRARTDDGRAHREVPDVSTVRRRLRTSCRRSCSSSLLLRRLGAVRPRAGCRGLRAARAEPGLARARRHGARPRPRHPRHASSRRPSASSSAAVAGVGVRGRDRAVAVRAAGGLPAPRRLADHPRDRARADPHRVARLRAAAEGRGGRARRVLPDRREHRRRARRTPIANASTSCAASAPAAGSGCASCRCRRRCRRSSRA